MTRSDKFGSHVFGLDSPPAGRACRSDRRRRERPRRDSHGGAPGPSAPAAPVPPVPALPVAGAAAAERSAHDQAVAPAAVGEAVRDALGRRPARGVRVEALLLSPRLGHRRRRAHGQGSRHRGAEERRPYSRDRPAHRPSRVGSPGGAGAECGTVAAGRRWRAQSPRRGAGNRLCWNGLRLWWRPGEIVSGASRRPGVRGGESAGMAHFSGHGTSFCSRQHRPAGRAPRLVGRGGNARAATRSRARRSLCGIST